MVKCCKLPMHNRVPLLLVAFVVVIFIAGSIARGQIGVEMTLESIQQWVGSLGWEAPLIYVVLVIFRQFLLLPSALLLPVGGLCFGVLAGTALGTAGIILSGIMKYAIARRIGGDAVEGWFGVRFQQFRRHLDRGGPVVVGLITAHPMGPMSWAHWGAGLSSIPLTTFAVAVAAGALLRTAAFALVGSTLLTPGSPQFFFASAVLLAAVVIPLAHRGLRRRLFGTFSTPGSPAAPL